MAATTASQPNVFRRIALFFKETVDELRKASWPTFQELRKSTILVFVAVGLLGAYISMVDFSLFQLVTFVTRWVKGS